MGWMWRNLARLSADEAERRRFVAAARRAWESIGFAHLVRDLEEEFADAG